MPGRDGLSRGATHRRGRAGARPRRSRGAGGGGGCGSRGARSPPRRGAGGRGPGAGPGDARVSLMGSARRPGGGSRRAAAALQRAAEERAGGAAAVPTGLQNPFRSGPRPSAWPPATEVAAEIARELAAAREAAAPQLRLSAGTRVRSGSSGLDALTELSGEIEGRLPARGLGGSFFARLTPVALSAGELPDNLTEIRRFGRQCADRPAARFRLLSRRIGQRPGRGGGGGLRTARLQSRHRHHSPRLPGDRIWSAGWRWRRRSPPACACA